MKAASTTLLSAIADGDDAPVTLDGCAWIVSPVDDVVMVRRVRDRDVPAVWLRGAWLADDATLADVVRMAIAEQAPREPLLASIAAALLAGRILATPRVTCERLRLATGATPRWGCYAEPCAVLITAEQVVPTVRPTDWGWDVDPLLEDDASPFGAALAFVREVGVTAARAALDRHPDGFGACDTETACSDCAAAYGIADAIEGDAGMVNDTAADASVANGSEEQ